ncbi:10584_t:CDS:2, partial [Acaulospora morrowiae]
FNLTTIFGTRFFGSFIWKLQNSFNSACLSTQFFRNAAPFFWQDVQILYFEQLQRLVEVLASQNQNFPYANYIRNLHITARTRRTPSKTRSPELKTLLYNLISIDASWNLLTFTLDLDIRDCHEVSLRTDFFAKMGHSLEQVSLHGSSPFCSDALSFSVGEYCTNLKKVVLESRYFHGYGIGHITEGCALTDLTIWCRQVTSSVIISILQGRCSQTLQFLTLKNCDLDDKPLLKNTDPKALLLPKLKSLTFIQLYEFSSGNILTSAGLLRLLESCPNLVELELETTGDSSLINDASIFNIIQKLQKLEDFSINNPFTSRLSFHHLGHFDVTVEGLLAALKDRPEVRLRVGAFDSIMSY